MCLRTDTEVPFFINRKKKVIAHNIVVRRTSWDVGMLCHKRIVALSCLCFIRGELQHSWIEKEHLQKGHIDAQIWILFLERKIPTWREVMVVVGRRGRF